jgi:DNA-binding transcriptional MerR regulator
MIPDKLYFKIGEVAKLIGVEPYVLRYWETEFSQITPVKSKTGQRLYKRHDVETIAAVRELLYDQKFTIDGARHKLKNIQRVLRKNADEVQMPLDLDQISTKPSEEILPNARKELSAIVDEMAAFLSS